MRTKHHTWAIALVSLMCATIPATTVRADLQDNLLWGLNLLDYQFDLQKNVLGNGYDFNTAAYYNSRIFRLGLAELTLGDTAPTTVSLQTGYTTRGLPSAHFSLANVGQPLSYTFDANYGFQDFVAQGSMLFNIDTRVNALGFYDLTLQISNRGTYTTDGFGLTENGSLDFDIGPIVISGNVYADAIAALTQPFFDATGTQNPFAKFSQEATKVAAFTETFDEVSARIRAGQPISSSDASKLVSNTILSALLGEEPSSNLFESLLLPTMLQEVMPAEMTHATNRALPVPEPGMASLLALGLIFCRRPRWA